MGIKVIGAVKSYKGKVREKNEDNFNLFGTYHSGRGTSFSCKGEMSGDIFSIAAVCDGIGGEQSGEVASELAVKGLCAMPDGFDSVAIQKRLTEINADIVRNARRLGNHMGSTFAGVYINKGNAICCNIGDSRIYMFRDGMFRQMSEDHTAVSLQIRQGLIKSEKDAPAGIRHVITQSLGTDPADFMIEPYISETIKLCENDVFLICSDGLTDAVGDEIMIKILSESEGVEKITEEFVSSAMELGSMDNITVLVIRVVGDTRDSISTDF